MAIYEYRCEEDGFFELGYPMGQAPSSTACPACGGAASRIFSSPRLALTSRSSRQIVSAIEHAEATSDRPDVVTSLPTDTRRARGSQTVPLNPTLLRLPRP